MLVIAISSIGVTALIGFIAFSVRASVTDGGRSTANSETPSVEIDRLARLLAAIRLRYQNLVAAALACLAAEALEQRRTCRSW